MKNSYSILMRLVFTLGQDLMGVSRAKRLPLFHLPQHGLPPKHLAPLLNSLCDFLFASAHRNDHAALTKHSSH